MRRTPRCIALVLFAALALPVLRPGGAQPDVTAERDLRRFVFFAVLEGLYELDLPDAVVDRITAVDARSRLPVCFVDACPICMPVLDAFRTYRVRPERFHGLKGEPPRDFASGADPALLAELGQEDVQKRTAAVGKLVERLVARRIAQMRWTAEEKSEWHSRFEGGRKEGLKLLESFRQGKDSPVSWMKGCAMCDGANDACTGK